jgi:hypothetical protein
MTPSAVSAEVSPAELVPAPTRTLHLVPESLPQVNGNSHAGAIGEDETLDESVEDMLKRLDETLNLIRSLRSGTDS